MSGEPINANRTNPLARLDVNVKGDSPGTASSVNASGRLVSSLKHPHSPSSNGPEFMKKQRLIPDVVQVKLSTKVIKRFVAPPLLKFKTAVNAIKNINAVVKAFGGSGELSADVVIGFDRVANYENQGIPPLYLEKTQEVADEEGVLIAIRPVEKICRTLIEEGRASKGLKIKGKSANWGPQAGFIPVKQELSKLATSAPETIEKANEVNRKAIFESGDAVQEHLHITSKRIHELESMGVLENVQKALPIEGARRAISFQSSPKGGRVHAFEAYQREGGQWDIFTINDSGEREALMVIPVTADFDLLFVLALYESIDLGIQDRNQAFHEEKGILTKRKDDVIKAMNERFDRGEDKNMVHHGADTENPVTDMDANLPATIFIPKFMLSKMGIYSDSPILIKTKSELERFYRAARAAGYKLEANRVWDRIQRVLREDIINKIKWFNQHSNEE